jgi:Tfp pilus assembly protein PilF
VSRQTKKAQVPRRVDTALLVTRGNAAMAAGEARAAADCYRAALEATPDHPAVLYNLGNALRACGDVAGAEAALRRSLALRPDQPAAHNNLGNLLRGAGRPAEAMEAYRHALYLNPLDSLVRGNLGTALMDLHRPQEAAVWLAQAVTAAPADAQARVNLGGALMLSGEPAAALAQYRQARALAPGLSDAGLGEGLARITLGDWIAGWDAYEARLRDPRFKLHATDLLGPRWNGPEPVRGRTLLLMSEQGLGDTLQCCRYVPLLRRRGARVVLRVQRPLLTLLRGLADTIAAPGDGLLRFDAWCPLMSLPRAFATTPETVPPPTPLAANPAVARAWRRRLGPRRGLRVGLAWSGNADHPLDALRSLPQDALGPLLGVPGIELHVLQPDARPADARIRAHPDIADFTDAAALAGLMDLVISVDTATAHLAGTLGLPVWILLPHAADFRWLMDRADTPWYPSARLFRQSRPRDWAGVVNAVAAALRDLARAPRPRAGR